MSGVIHTGSPAAFSETSHPEENRRPCADREFSFSHPPPVTSPLRTPRATTQAYPFGVLTPLQELKMPSRPSPSPRSIKRPPSTTPPPALTSPLSLTPPFLSPTHAITLTLSPDSRSQLTTVTRSPLTPSEAGDSSPSPLPSCLMPSPAPSGTPSPQLLTIPAPITGTGLHSPNVPDPDATAQGAPWGLRKLRGVLVAPQARGGNCAPSVAPDAPLRSCVRADGRALSPEGLYAARATTAAAPGSLSSHAVTAHAHTNSAVLRADAMRSPASPSGSDLGGVVEGVGATHEDALTQLSPIHPDMPRLAALIRGCTHSDVLGHVFGSVNEEVDTAWDGFSPDSDTREQKAAAISEGVAQGFIAPQARGYVPHSRVAATTPYSRTLPRTIPPPRMPAPLPVALPTATVVPTSNMTIAVHPPAHHAPHQPEHTPAVLSSLPEHASALGRPRVADAPSVHDEVCGGTVAEALLRRRRLHVGIGRGDPLGAPSPLRTPALCPLGGASHPIAVEGDAGGGSGFLNKLVDVCAEEVVPHVDHGGAAGEWHSSAIAVSDTHVYASDTAALEAYAESPSGWSGSTRGGSLTPSTPTPHATTRKDFGKFSRLPLPPLAEKRQRELVQQRGTRAHAHKNAQPSTARAFRAVPSPSSPMLTPPSPHTHCKARRVPTAVLLQRLMPHEQLMREARAAADAQWVVPEAVPEEVEDAGPRSDTAMAAQGEHFAVGQTGAIESVGAVDQPLGGKSAEKCAELRETDTERAKTENASEENRTGGAGDKLTERVGPHRRRGLVSVWTLAMVEPIGEVEVEVAPATPEEIAEMQRAEKAKERAATLASASWESAPPPRRKKKKQRRRRWWRKLERAALREKAAELFVAAATEEVKESSETRVTPPGFVPCSPCKEGIWPHMASYSQFYWPREALTPLRRRERRWPDPLPTPQQRATAAAEARQKAAAAWAKQKAEEGRRRARDRARAREEERGKAATAARVWMLDSAGKPQLAVRRGNLPSRVRAREHVPVSNPAKRQRVPLHVATAPQHSLKSREGTSASASISSLGQLQRTSGSAGDSGAGAAGHSHPPSLCPAPLPVLITSPMATVTPNALRSPAFTSILIPDPSTRAGVVATTAEGTGSSSTLPTEPTGVLDAPHAITEDVRPLPWPSPEAPLSSVHRSPGSHREEAHMALNTLFSPREPHVFHQGSGSSNTDKGDSVRIDEETEVKVPHEDNHQSSRDSGASAQSPEGAAVMRTLLGIHGEEAREDASVCGVVDGDKGVAWKQEGAARTPSCTVTGHADTTRETSLGQCLGLSMELSVDRSLGLSLGGVHAPIIAGTIEDERAPDKTLIVAGGARSVSASTSESGPLSELAKSPALERVESRECEPVRTLYHTIHHTATTRAPPPLRRGQFLSPRPSSRGSSRPVSRTSSHPSLASIVDLRAPSPPALARAASDENMDKLRLRTVRSAGSVYSSPGSSAATTSPSHSPPSSPSPASGVRPRDAMLGNRNVHATTLANGAAAQIDTRRAPATAARPALSLLDPSLHAIAGAPHSTDPIAAQESSSPVSLTTLVPTLSRQTTKSRPSTLAIPLPSANIQPLPLPTLSPAAIQHLARARTADNTYRPPDAHSPRATLLRRLATCRFGATLPCRMTAAGVLVPTVQFVDTSGALLNEFSVAANATLSEARVESGGSGAEISTPSVVASTPIFGEEAARTFTLLPVEHIDAVASYRTMTCSNETGSMSVDISPTLLGNSSRASLVVSPVTGSQGSAACILNEGVEITEDGCTGQLFASNSGCDTDTESEVSMKDVDPSDLPRLLRRQRRPQPTENYWARGHRTSYVVSGEVLVPLQVCNTVTSFPPLSPRVPLALPRCAFLLPEKSASSGDVTHICDAPAHVMPAVETQARLRGESPGEHISDAARSGAAGSAVQLGRVLIADDDRNLSPGHVIHVKDGLGGQLYTLPMWHAWHCGCLKGCLDAHCAGGHYHDTGHRGSKQHGNRLLRLRALEVGHPGGQPESDRARTATALAPRGAAGVPTPALLPTNQPTETSHASAVDGVDPPDAKVNTDPDERGDAVVTLDRPPSFTPSALSTERPQSMAAPPVVTPAAVLAHTLRRVVTPGTPGNPHVPVVPNLPKCPRALPLCQSAATMWMALDVRTHSQDVDILGVALLAPPFDNGLTCMRSHFLTLPIRIAASNSNFEDEGVDVSRRAEVQASPSMAKPLVRESGRGSQVGIAATRSQASVSTYHEHSCRSDNNIAFAAYTRIGARRFQQDALLCMPVLQGSSGEEAVFVVGDGHGLAGDMSRVAVNTLGDVLGSWVARDIPGGFPYVRPIPTPVRLTRKSSAASSSRGDAGSSKSGLEASQSSPLAKLSPMADSIGFLDEAWQQKRHVPNTESWLPEHLVNVALSSHCGVEPLSPRPCALLMRHAFTFAEESVRTHFTGKQGGATIAGVRVNGRQRCVVVGHLGDARVALVRRGRVIRATRDHSAADPLEAEAVRARGGMVMDVDGCARVAGELATARSLGDWAYKPAVSCNPEVEMWPFQPGDVLLLCSDGAWRVEGMEGCACMTEASGDPDRHAFAADVGRTIGTVEKQLQAREHPKQSEAPPRTHDLSANAGGGPEPARTPRDTTTAEVEAGAMQLCSQVVEEIYRELQRLQRDHCVCLCASRRDSSNHVDSEGMCTDCSHYVCEYCVEPRWCVMGASLDISAVMRIDELLGNTSTAEPIPQTGLWGLASMPSVSQQAGVFLAQLAEQLAKRLPASLAGEGYCASDEKDDLQAPHPAPQTAFVTFFKERIAQLPALRSCAEALLWARAMHCRHRRHLGNHRAVMSADRAVRRVTVHRCSQGQAIGGEEEAHYVLSRSPAPTSMPLPAASPSPTVLYRQGPLQTIPAQPPTQATRGLNLMSSGGAMYTPTEPAIDRSFSLSSTPRHTHARTPGGTLLYTPTLAATPSPAALATPRLKRSLSLSLSTEAAANTPAVPSAPSTRTRRAAMSEEDEDTLVWGLPAIEEVAMPGQDGSLLGDSSTTAGGTSNSHASTDRKEVATTTAACLAMLPGDAETMEAQWGLSDLSEQSDLNGHGLEGGNVGRAARARSMVSHAREIDRSVKEDVCAPTPRVGGGTRATQSMHSGTSVVQPDERASDLTAPSLTPAVSIFSFGIGDPVVPRFKEPSSVVTAPTPVADPHAPLTPREEQSRMSAVTLGLISPRLVWSPALARASHEVVDAVARTAPAASAEALEPLRLEGVRSLTLHDKSSPNATAAPAAAAVDVSVHRAVDMDAELQGIYMEDDWTTESPDSAEEKREWKRAAEKVRQLHDSLTNEVVSGHSQSGGDDSSSSSSSDENGLAALHTLAPANAAATPTTVAEAIALVKQQLPGKALDTLVETRGETSATSGLAHEGPLVTTLTSLSLRTPTGLPPRSALQPAGHTPPIILPPAPRAQLAYARPLRPRGGSISYTASVVSDTDRLGLNTTSDEDVDSPIAAIGDPESTPPAIADALARLSPVAPAPATQDDSASSESVPFEPLQLRRGTPLSSLLSSPFSYNAAARDGQGSGRRLGVQESSSVASPRRPTSSRTVVPYTPPMSSPSATSGTVFSHVSRQAFTAAMGYQSPSLSTEQSRGGSPATGSSFPSSGGSRYTGAGPRVTPVPTNLPTCSLSRRHSSPPSNTASTEASSLSPGGDNAVEQYAEGTMSKQAVRSPGKWAWQCAIGPLNDANSNPAPPSVPPTPRTPSTPRAPGPSSRATVTSTYAWALRSLAAMKEDVLREEEDEHDDHRVARDMAGAGDTDDEGSGDKVVTLDGGSPPLWLHRGLGPTEAGPGATTAEEVDITVHERGMWWPRARSRQPTAHAPKHSETLRRQEAVCVVHLARTLAATAAAKPGSDNVSVIAVDLAQYIRDDLDKPSHVE